MDWTNKHLGRPFVPRWIYGDVAPHNEELDETIQAVEQALGFKLSCGRKLLSSRASSGKWEQLRHKFCVIC